MKNIRFNIFLFVLIASTIYVACRKVDHQQAPDEINGNNIEENFFNSNRSSDPTEKALVDFIKRINDKEHFVEKAVKQIGYPRWNKIISPSASRRAGKAISDSSGITYYIPFVRDSQNYVNASIAIRANPDDTTFSYLCDWQYAQM